MNDQQWVNGALPNLLSSGGGGGDDSRKPQVRMAEAMHNPDRELRGFLNTTRSSGDYKALHALVEEYVQRTQSVLRAAGYQSIDLYRRGWRSELGNPKNLARSWTTQPRLVDGSGYHGDTVYCASVPVEHIVAFRGVLEQEVFVSRESMDSSRNRLRLSIRSEPGDTIRHRLKNWWDVRNQ